jgi:hypothetical protein
VEIMSFLTKQPREAIIEKKLIQFVPDLLAGVNGLKRTASLQSDYTDEAHMKELDDLRLAKLNYQKVNFNIAEQFFRIFCRNQYVEHSYFLRADLKSFNKGI